MDARVDAQMNVLNVLSDAPSNTIGLARQTGLPLLSISEASGLLICRGYVERSIDGDYSLTAEGELFKASGERIGSGPAGTNRALRRFPNSFRQRCWTAMRLEKRFIVPDILILAQKSEKHARDNLHFYIRRLVAGGILARLPGLAEGDALTSPGYPIYLVLRDVGPLAPIIKRNGSLVDPNEEIAA